MSVYNIAASALILINAIFILWRIRKLIFGLFFIPAFAVFFLRIGIGHFILLKTALVAVSLVLFICLLFFSADFYAFKLLFYSVLFFLMLGMMVLLGEIASIPGIPAAFFEAPVFILYFAAIPSMLKKERLRIENRFFNILVTTAVIFPVALILLNAILLSEYFDRTTDLFIIGFILSFSLSVIFILLKPVINLLLPVYTNFSANLASYLSEIMRISHKDGILKYSSVFLKKLLPLPGLEIKFGSDNAEFVFMERKGRFLFHEEHEFLKIIERQLNIRLKNILFTERLEANLLKIQDLQEHIARNRVYSVMGQMAATITHKIRNPLAVMNNSIELLREDKFSLEEKLVMIQTLEEEVKRLDGIVGSFLRFVKNPAYDISDIEVKPIVDTIMSGNRFPTGNFKEEYRTERFRANAEGLAEILFVIIQNAFDAVEDTPDGLVELTVDENAITISDNGTALPEPPDRIFEPFFSTKAKGVGLGLSIVKNTAEQMGIRISVKVENGKKSFILSGRDLNEDNDR